ncbi:hypothetical protein POM88_037896 [Heracleum sosnowskyi]|uniref:F-box associated beta-propeller type 1 domain-containing protein n=1 Tax=Heracleum sosnowskyi TaxID=360622 RepID=A0AAD8HSB5_9APIA|nr:hypothetical protein POM88_037896 [Heracleum sosnowskyi]
MLPVSRLSEYYSNEIEWKALAFGFLPEVNDYVVVHVVKLETVFPDDSDQDSPDYLELLNYISNTVMIGVYSLNTGSWKISSQDDVEITWVWTEQSVYVNGTAFWIGEDYAADQLVIQFDTKTEMYCEKSRCLRSLELRNVSILLFIHLVNLLLTLLKTLNFDTWTCGY